jgi:hypothetical protein
LQEDVQFGDLLVLHLDLCPQERDLGAEILPTIPLPTPLPIGLSSGLPTLSTLSTLLPVIVVKDEPLPVALLRRDVPPLCPFAQAGNGNAPPTCRLVEWDATPLRHGYPPAHTLPI